MFEGGGGFPTALGRIVCISVSYIVLSISSAGSAVTNTLLLLCIIYV